MAGFRYSQRRRHLRRGAEAVGVHPRFQRKAPAVCFGDEDVQRVEAGVLPLLAGAEMAPRKQGAPVKSIPERPHLRDDGVQPDGQTVVHQLRRTGTEGFFGGKVHPGPFQIAHPDGPPFTRGQGGVGLCFVHRRHRRRRGRLAPASAAQPAPARNARRPNRPRRAQRLLRRWVMRPPASYRGSALPNPGRRPAAPRAGSSRSPARPCRRISP